MKEKQLLYRVADLGFTEPELISSIEEEQAILFEEFITENFDLPNCAGKTAYLKNNWFSKIKYDCVEVYFRVVDQFENEDQIYKYLVLDVTFLHFFETI